MSTLEQEVQIGEGPAVAAAGLSPDKRMLVVQRSPLHLQCLLLPSANMFLQASIAPLPCNPFIGCPHSCKVAFGPRLGLPWTAFTGALNTSEGIMLAGSIAFQYGRLSSYA